jgi:hypothetical protein
MEVVMLEQYFLRPTTVDRIRSNWLGPKKSERYVEWMHDQKYAQRNITRRLALLCHFVDFARANGATDLASLLLRVLWSKSLATTGWPVAGVGISKLVSSSVETCAALFAICCG